MPYRGANHSEVKFVGSGSTSFDGTDDKITVSNSSSLNIAGDMSCIFWMKRTDSTAIDDLVIKRDGGGTNYQFDINASDKVRAFDGSTTVTANGSITLNEWTHIAYSVKDNVVSIYVNGVLDISASLTITADDADLTIGHNPTGSEYYKGNLKNVAIWSRALTATEIQNVMYKTNDELTGRLTSNLVSWWALDASGLGSDIFAINSVATGWSYSDGVLTASNVVDETDADSGINPVAGESYQISYEITSISEGGIFFRGGGASSTTQTTVGTYTETLLMGSTAGLVFRADGELSATIENITLKKVTVEDLKSSNDGTVIGATIDEDLYGGDTPVKPRAIDNAPTVQADGIGIGSASFDGVDDYIDTGNSFQSTFRNDFSITFWMKPDDGQPSSQEYMIGMRDSGGTDGNVLILNTDGKLIWRYRCNNGTEMEATTSSVVFADGVTDWTHIAMTTDDGNDDIYLYVNGVSYALNDDLSGVTMSDFTLNETFSIGSQNDAGTNGNFFDGNICQLGIWSKAMTQAQVLSVMEKTYDEFNADDKTSLVSYWALDEAVGGESKHIEDLVDTSLGAELVTNGDLSSDPFVHATDYSGGWSDTSTNTTATWSSSNATIALTGGGDLGTTRGNATLRISAVSGKVYKLTYSNSTTPSNSNLKIGTVNDWTSSNIANPSPLSNKTWYFTSTTTGYIYITFSVYDTVTWTFGNVSVKQVQGNYGELK